MNKLFKPAMLTLALAVSHAYAGGIPVIDGTAVAQNAANSAKQLAEMAKQLIEAKNQLEQLKANVDALTGIKGFSDVMKLGGINDEIVGTFDDLLNGNTAGLTAKAQSYFENLPDCSGSKNPSMCESAALGGIAELDFVEKLTAQVEGKLDKITELSERIKSAKDMKSMAELQANIALEANSIALIQQQTVNFERLQAAQEKIARKQAQIQYKKQKEESARLIYESAANSGTTAKKTNSNFQDILNASRK